MRATGRELALVAALTLAANLAANLAWLDALFDTEASGRLTGIHTLNSEDTPTYYAWIDQARRGAILFRQLYTPEPHEPALFSPLFNVAGWLGSAADLGNAGSFHAMRVLLGLLLVPLAWMFYRRALESPRERLAALSVFLFCGGLGWLFTGADVASWPIDLWMPEAFAFLSLVESPLNLASFALYAGIGTALLVHLETGSRVAAGAVGGGALVLVALRPYAAAPLVALAVAGPGLAAALRRVAPARALVAALCVVGGVAVGILPALGALRSPAFGAWGASSRVPAPSLPSLLLGLAGPLLLAGPGFRPALSRGVAGPLCLAWVGVCLLLCYAPLGPQTAFARKMLEGVSLPLAALAGLGIGRWLASSERSASARLVTVILLFGLALPSNALLLGRDARAFAGGAIPYRLPECVADGFERLREVGTTGEVVLADPLLGGLVPAFSGLPVVCCHRDQTIDPVSKRREVEAFFATGASDDAQRSTLERHAVRLVLFPPGAVPPRALQARLERVPDTGCLGVYRVGGEDR